MIHDNGARPFKVVITKNKISVYKHKPYDGTDMEDPYDIEDKYYTKFNTKTIIKRLQ